MTEGLHSKAARIQVLIMDVDGVMTDGGLYYGTGDARMKRFDAKDGMGVALLQAAGVRCAIITCGGDTQIVNDRAARLRIRDVVHLPSDGNKGAAVRQLLTRLNVSRDEAAYVGDDVNDIPAMRQVGLAIAVADALAEVQEAAEWVTQRPGGRGAVREVADAILDARSSAGRSPTQCGA